MPFATSSGHTRLRSVESGYERCAPRGLSRLLRAVMERTMVGPQFRLRLPATGTEDPQKRAQQC
eukprot:2656068-Rhodomonas_salina.4